MDPYNARLLVTPAYLRLDDGVDDGDFALFDRASRVIYSVTHRDRTVLEIHPRPVDVPAPLALVQSVEKVAAADAPAVGGHQPQQLRLLVNGEQCYSLVAVDGLLPDAVTALRAYRGVLAGEGARVLPQVPADMQDPCDLALNVYAPSWQLEFGLPIQEVDSQGKGQALLDYNAAYPVDDSLFTLPKGYQHYTPDDVQ